VRAAPSLLPSARKRCALPRFEIADAATPETVNVARLRVDSRKFTVARLAPKKYGDHISHNVKGGGINFQPQILIQCSSAGDDEH
jgi:hypothetical protein